MFQHTAARRRLPKNLNFYIRLIDVSTHSRAEAAARCIESILANQYKFQHTAARRRLQEPKTILYVPTCVSTHSRAEAAAR